MKDKDEFETPLTPLLEKSYSKGHIKNKSTPDFCSPKELAQSRYCRGRHINGRSYLVELDKENSRRLAQQINRPETDFSTAPNTSNKKLSRLKNSPDGCDDLQQFSSASLNYSLSLTNKTLIEYCMANTLATSALQTLGSNS